MARIFDITTTDDSLALKAGSAGRIVFTVSNITQKPQRGSLRARVLDSGQASWLTLSGDAERAFSPGFTHQVELNVRVPADTPPGKFRVRLDALSVANPDDDFTEGPAIGVVVAAPDAPEPKTTPWWIWLIVGLVVLIVAGVIAFLMMRRPDPGKGPDIPPSAPSQPTSQPTSQTPPEPATQEFNDPRINVAEGALPLDVCRNWATNCGKPAADAYCVSKGWATAIDFRIAMDSPPTVVIGSHAVCREQSCDRITWVKCTSRLMRPVRLNAQTLQHLQIMRLKGKQVEP